MRLQKVRLLAAGFFIQVFGLLAASAHAQTAVPGIESDRAPARTLTQAGSGTFLDRGMNLQLEFMLPSANASGSAEDCEADQAAQLISSGPTARFHTGFDAILQQSGPGKARYTKLALADTLAIEPPAPIADKASETSRPDGMLIAQNSVPAAETKAETKASPAPARTWDIAVSDKTLNAALARWAANAGWQLIWELPVDYAVEARTSMPGTFEEAVAKVASSMENAEVPLKAIFYQGNNVLRIVAKGVE